MIEVKEGGIELSYPLGLLECVRSMASQYRGGVPLGLPHNLRIIV